ncbi:Outer membrane protein [Candidatus Terasakiella magnetica]|nr:Outer membrane protein [Candidatus Terasakiella magnetica]
MHDLASRFALFLRHAALAATLASGMVCGGASSAMAENKMATPVIIIVDVQQAQRESVAGKSLMVQRDKYQQNFQAEFNAARQHLQTSDQELAKQKGAVAQDVYDQRVKALEQQVVAFQRRTQVAVRALEKSTDTASSELMNIILSITGELAGEVGATLVLPKQQVVLHEPKMDVTSQVIERLNRRLPTITFPVPVVDESAVTSSSPSPSPSPALAQPVAKPGKK